MSDPAAIPSDPSSRSDILRMNEHLRAFWDIAQRVDGALSIKGAAFTKGGNPMILIERSGPPVVSVPDQAAA